MKKPQQVVQEPTEETKGNNKPDWLIKVRQPPTRGSDGKLYQSENFATVGAAWNKVDKNGRPFVGAKLNIAGLTFADNSFILYPPYDEEKG